MRENTAKKLGNGVEVIVKVRKERLPALFHSLNTDRTANVTLRPTEGQVIGTGARVFISSLERGQE